MGRESVQTPLGAGDWIIVLRKIDTHHASVSSTQLTVHLYVTTGNKALFFYIPNEKYYGA